MFEYSVIQWLFFFYLYCFFGWCFESSYVSLKSRKLVNRGFMKGPFLPLYGSGAIMMLLVSRPFLEHWWAVYAAGCIGATLLEYVTGVVMEALFKVRYWDYSGKPFNFQGHICLGSSLAWGGLTLLMTYVVHKPIETFVLGVPGAVLTVVTVFLTICIASDFTLAFKAAMDLRDVLSHMEKVKEELLRIQRRLDVIIAVTSEEWNAKKEAFAENVEQKRESLAGKLHTEELKESIERKLAALKENLQKEPTEYTEDTREEILDLRTKYKLNEQEHERMGSRKALHRLFSSNPTMSSVRYKEVLEEIKQKAEEKRKRK